MEETIEISNEIATLNQMNDLATRETTAVAEARLKPNPLEDVENELSVFTKKSFENILDAEYAFQNKIQKTISSRLDLDEKEGGFSNRELVALHTENAATLNDRISKVLGPTFTLMTQEHTAQIQAKASIEKQKVESASVNVQINNGNNDPTASRLNEDVGQQVLQGMFALFNMANTLNGAKPEEKPAEKVEN